MRALFSQLYLPVAVLNTSALRLFSMNVSELVLRNSQVKGVERNAFLTVIFFKKTLLTLFRSLFLLLKIFALQPV